MRMKWYGWKPRQKTWQKIPSASEKILIYLQREREMKQKKAISRPGTAANHDG